MIAARALSRSFGGTPAVEDLTFEVPEGRLFALLGPNGAGKTTTVRMLMGLIGPTAGSATVAGIPLGGGPAGGAALRAACGLLTETPGFYDRLSAWDNLLFFARLYGLPETTLASRLETHLRTMELWERRESPVGSFSKGMKQRLAIIRAVFHDPPVVFLDEPTAGLDPEAALAVRDLILQLKAGGRTIVMCTHNLDEAERLADIVGILRCRLLVCDTLERLRAGASAAATGTRVRITLVGNALEHTAAAASLAFARDVEAHGSVFGATLTRAETDIPRLVAWLVERGAGVLDVRSERESLESIYLRCIHGAP